ncbi:MAG: TonB-dependent receptor, partial [Bacteroidota bacterium]
MKNVIAFILVMNLSVSVYAQNISGVVKDRNLKAPIASVTIYNYSKNNHVHTDVNGKFTLGEIDAGDSIVVSMIGYERLSLIYTSESDLDIFLKEVPVQLDQIVITPDLSTLNQIRDVDLQINPVNSSQEMLIKVPGLFIAQHAGGGKAEQIFLRGFDIDHGTDVQITTDGMPVNMVSHAHGQGYADLHYLIPETVEAIDFGKGPYYTQKGNFATAGYVDFKTKEKVDGSSVKLEVGDFSTLRMVSILDLLEGNDHSNAYVATEYLITDGPFDASQNFNRLNLFGKFNTRINNDRLGVQLSTFNSKWDASGQIPLRAIESGIIGRFGAIDDTEGGETSRSNFLVDFTKTISEKEFIETKAFVSRYDFELYSNFTFFLEDPVNGDQIRQKEKRTIYGIQADHHYVTRIGSGDLTLTNGVGFRYDDINGNELSHTRNRRETLDTLSLSDTDETNGFLFSSAEWEIGDWLINAGLRLDHFRFESIDFLRADYERSSATQSMFSPKLNVVYKASQGLQFYAKSGRGFHSNDARVVLSSTNGNTLPAAVGFDLGTIYRPFDRLIIDVAYWQLYLQQEFVYVGDAGIVEPSGKTQRTGVDVGVNYQLTERLFAFVNIN